MELDRTRTAQRGILEREELGRNWNRVGAEFERNFI